MRYIDFNGPQEVIRTKVYNPSRRFGPHASGLCLCCRLVVWQVEDKSQRWTRRCEDRRGNGYSG